MRNLNIVCKKIRQNFVFGCLILLATFAPAFPQKQNSIDVPTLLREAKQRSDESWQAMMREQVNYTYKWRKTWREAKKNGEVEEKSELYEIFIPKNCRALKKCRSAVVFLAANDKPLAPEKIEKQKIKAGKQLEKMEREPKSLNKATTTAQPNWMRFAYFIFVPLSTERKIIVKIDGQEILEKCDFFAPVIEIINGRETIALNFRPRIVAIFSKETIYAPNIEGKVWIDAADKVFVRLAMWEKGKQFENQMSDYLLENAALAYDSTRTKEGFWFFRLGRINGLKNPNLFAEMKGDFSIVHFDHHYFKTEIKAVEINNPTEKKQ